MVQTMVVGKASGISKRRRKPQPETKQCLFCNSSFRAAKQSKFCSSYCVEQACRRRKEALIEAFADLLVERSEDLTRTVYGVAFQITFDQAYSKAGQCIQAQHKVFKLKLEQLGYQYNETAKVWQRLKLLP